MAVGTAILLFHAGRMPYFWMVMGLFPASLAALIVGPILDRLPTRQARGAFLGMIWGPLLLLAAAQAGTLTIQRQAHQRASLEFVERAFPPEARGFEGHTAFSCRQDLEPLPAMFPYHIEMAFGGEDAHEQARAFIEEFRNRPVQYMILTRGQLYPREVWEFWHTSYVHYFGAVHVPGRGITGGPGWRDSVEIIVDGEYVWRTRGDARVHVGGHVLDPGERVFLRRGRYPLELPHGRDGMLVLGLPDPPAPDTTPFFLGF
jgi:hypothetical protein